MKEAIGRLCVEAEDFSRYRLKRDHVEKWEDNRRLIDDCREGGYEWWYTDVHFGNGSMIVVTFLYRVDANGQLVPELSFNYVKENVIQCNNLIVYPPESMTIAEGQCEFYIGKSYFKSIDGLDAYEVYVDAAENEGFGCHLTLNRGAPSYRPGTGYWDVDGDYFAWVVAIPSGSVTGEVEYNGQKETIQGSCYHDHNWGNVPMDRVLRDWLWGRAEVDGQTVVSASVKFRQDKGNATTPLLYITQGEQILLSVCNEELTCLEGGAVAHPDTGKLINSDCIYLYENGDDYASVRFDGQQRVVATLEIISTQPDWKAYYARFASQATIDYNLNGECRRCKGHSVLESMDFFGLYVGQ